MCNTVKVDILYASDQWCHHKSIDLIHNAVDTDCNLILMLSSIPLKIKSLNFIYILLLKARCGFCVRLLVRHAVSQLWHMGGYNGFVGG